MVKSLAALFVAASLSACSGTDDSIQVASQTEGREEIGQVHQQLGEPGCGTLFLPDAVLTVNPLAESTSSDPYYDHVNCPKQYVVEFTGGLSADWIGGGWADPPPDNESDCQNARVDIGAYRFFAAQNSWQYYSQDRQHGVWSDQSCSFVSDTLFDEFAGLGLPSTNKFRLAVSAYQWDVQVKIIPGGPNYGFFLTFTKKMANAKAFARSYF